jgi:hypothetical protein
MIIKINPIMNTKEVSCNVRKSMKNSVPIVRQPIVSSVEVLPSKGSSWDSVVCMI